MVVITSVIIIALSIIVMGNKAIKTNSDVTLSSTNYTKNVSYNLDFNNSKYKLKTIKANGKSIKIR